MPVTIRLSIRKILSLPVRVLTYFAVGSAIKSIDARPAGIGDLAVGLWIAEGARHNGEKVFFVSGGQDPIVRAFGHEVVSSPTDDCMLLGGGSPVYNEELHTSSLDASPRTLRWQRSMGWDFSPRRPILSGLNANALKWASEMLEGKPVAVIAPRAAHGSRSLPLQKWIRTAWSLHDDGIRTIAIDREREVVEPFPHYAFGYDWQHVLALLSLARVVAGNDSGIPHLSATIGVPTVVAMGPTVGPIIFGHCSDVVRQVSRPDIPCFGCHFRHDKGYRIACDHGCEALSMISWMTLQSEIVRAMVGPEKCDLQICSLGDSKSIV